MRATFTITVLVLSLVSSSLCHKLNMTKFLEENFLPQLFAAKPLRDVPAEISLRDISYLPEDYSEMENQDDLETLDRSNRNLTPNYRSLCELRKRKETLGDSEYEFQPPQYEEVFCKSYPSTGQAQHSTTPTKQVCAHPGFHCVQRWRTIVLAKRRWSSDCWEPFTKVVASGCDCMWPVSTLGEITGHY